MDGPSVVVNFHTETSGKRDHMQRYVMISNKNLGDINPLDCGEETCAPDFCAYPCKRQYHLIHYVFSGSGIFCIDGIDYPVSSQQISIIPQNMLAGYHADPSNPWHYAWIGFTSGIDIPFIHENRVVDIPQADSIFRDLKDADRFTVGREYYITGKIYELLCLFEQLSKNANNRSNEYVLKAKNYMEINYSNAIAIQEIAEQLQISTTHLGALFRKQEGVSPHQYLIDIRLQKASELMRLQDDKIGKIAFMVGYPDIYSFSKAFKKKFGLTPIEYRHKTKAHPDGGLV